MAALAVVLLVAAGNITIIVWYGRIHGLMWFLLWEQVSLVLNRRYPKFFQAIIDVR